MSSNCSIPPEKFEGNCSNRGLLLPILNESEWSVPVRAVLYFVGLLYMFLGISIAADVFMMAIERITSEKKTIKTVDPETGQKVRKEIDVWNPTVANLSLMALGSSAPEILLSIIEIVGNDFYSGALGPSTIVGSAAFNLLVITAVCIASIPAGEKRRVGQFMVFVITASFGLFAYLWLFMVLVVSSKDVVELWEAITTLVFFVILITGAYLADKRLCCKGAPDEDYMDIPRRGETWLSEADLTGYKHDYSDARSGMNVKVKDEDKLATGSLAYGTIERELAVKNPELTANQVARLTASAINKLRSHSRIYYRLKATKWLSNTVNEEKESQQIPGASNTLAESSKTRQKVDTSKRLAVIEFSAERYAVKENEKTAYVAVIRHGNMDEDVSAFVETISGSAEEGSDFVPFSKSVHFRPKQTEVKLKIPIVQDDVPELDEIFYLRLDFDHPSDKESVSIGPVYIAEVTITEKENPCTVSLEKNSFIVEETCGEARLPLVRSGQFNRSVTVQWRTKDVTANDGLDYLGGKGEVTFLPGEVRKPIPIPIIDDVEVNEKHETFKIHLIKISPGAKIGEEKSAVVTIVGDERVYQWFNSVDQMAQNALEEINEVGSTSWRGQFERALNVNNGDVEGASFFDYVYHVTAFGWKFLFAFVPPAHYLRGWLTFVIALIMIGGLTAVVADFASIFGCLVHLNDEVTAITFVALGTSLPDLFASKLAAVNEKNADNSVGNINGSNSVNVFLGLGLPWLIAAVYWHMKDEQFCVYSGSLAFSVSIYTATAITCIILLLIRRFTAFGGKAELGGPIGTKYFSALILVCLWITYVTLSALSTYDVIKV